SVIDAAEAAGATLLFPGNLYNYGSPLPAVIDEATPMHSTSRKGQLRVTIEQRLAEAAERGIRVIILRAGDFYGRGRGSWFDLVVAHSPGTPDRADVPRAFRDRLSLEGAAPDRWCKTRRGHRRRPAHRSRRRGPARPAGPRCDQLNDLPRA